MSSSDDLTAEQLRAIGDRAAEFRAWTERLQKRGKALGWSEDDVLMQRLREAAERASWLAVLCGSRATDLEQK